MHRELENYHFV